MAEWVAVAYGALDVADRDDFGDGVEVLVLPVKPEKPLGIGGEVAVFWLSFVTGPVDDSNLNDEERYLLDEFVHTGIVSRNLDHPARITEVKKPWLLSPMHELVNSMVGSIARDNRIDLLIIKGPVLTWQGIRGKKHSGDVDVWVEPTQIDRLSMLLVKWRWVPENDIWGDTDLNHSSTLNQTEWGCQIDLHREFPGIGVSREEAFRTLIDHSEELDFAGVTLRCPAREFHVIISALHALRPEVGHGGNQGGLKKATAVLKAVGPLSIECAEQLDALAALDPALRAAFPEHDFREPGPLPANWTWRSQDNKLLGYLMAMRRLSWWQRLRFVRKVLWPNAEVVKASNDLVGGAAGSVFRLRVRRFQRGFSQVIIGRKRRRG